MVASPGQVPPLSHTQLHLFRTRCIGNELQARHQNASLVGQRCAGLSPGSADRKRQIAPYPRLTLPGFRFRYAHGSLSPRIQRTELLWMRLLVKGALLRQRRGYEQTLRLRSFALWRLKPPECRIRSASAESSHQLPMSGYVWHEPDQPGRSGDVR